MKDKKVSSRQKRCLCVCAFFSTLSSKLSKLKKLQSAALLFFFFLLFRNVLVRNYAHKSTRTTNTSHTHINILNEEEDANFRENLDGQNHHLGSGVFGYHR